MTAPASQSRSIRLPMVGRVDRRWVIIGAGSVAVIVIYAYWAKSRRQETMTVDTTTGGLGSDTAYVNPAPRTTVVSGTVQSDQDLIATREQWGEAAVLRLIDLEWEPMFAATAIGKYLLGEPLNTEEARAVRAARAILPDVPGGNPPIKMEASGPAPGTPGKPPAPAPGSPAKAPKYVDTAKFTTKNPPWNSTLSGIANHEKTTVSALLKLNPWIIDKNKIPYPGRIRVS